MSAPALIVFAKAPAPGRAKTRLTELLTAAEAAALYEAFLRDTLAAQATLAERRGATLRLYHAGPRWPARLTPEAASLHRQQGNDLGERIDAAFRETFADGADAALVTGTDHPTLPPAFVARGLDALRDGSREAVCLGPTEDGGFYLLGLTRPRPALFAGMTYSHAEVFEQTLARATADAGAPPVVLPEWYDVDRPADLRRLAAALFKDESTLARAPHTHRQVRALTETYPDALHPPAVEAK
jgi:rSAM/selenodomain-associated transferase 1